MRVLFWFCGRIAWRPVQQTLEDAAPAEPGHPLARIYKEW